MIRFLYNLLFPFALLFFLPGYLLKMQRRGNYRRNFGQRFGIYGKELRARLARQSSTWIHAVSVGEVAVALKLAAKLHELDGTFRCVLTTTTTTGYGFASKEAPDWMEVMYNPLDFWPIVRSAFEVIRPTRIVLIEAEIWPNLAATARSRRVPLALVNARLSVRAEGRFRRFSLFVRPMFRCLDLVCVQEEKDVPRWAALGVESRAIKEVGSIKYDATEAQFDGVLAQEVLARFGIAESQPILFGGSTHAGEEAVLAGALLRLREEFPAMVLLVAPRHVERKAGVLRVLEERGLRVGLRSEAETAPKLGADCVVLDTTGELRNWYATATVVFVGKSLTAHGGQNPVEPIIAGKPVVFGPHMENFASLAEALLQTDAAIQIQDEDELSAAVAELLRDSARRSQLVENAGRVLAHHRGATQRTAELLLASNFNDRSRQHSAK